MGGSARQQTNGLLSGIHKDLKPLVKECLRIGWTFQQRGKAHPMLRCPEGCHRIPVPSSSSGAGTHLAVRSQVRKAREAHEC